MTFAEAQAQYIAALRKILADDPVTGPLIAERDALPPNTAAVGDLNNQIRNAAASDDARRAMQALRDLRLGP